MKTKTQFLWDITVRYRDAGEAWPTTAKNIAAWAIRAKLWAPSPRNLIDQCAGELAAAMREEFFTDDQGRRVRKKHAIREVVALPEGKHDQMIWVDIEDASPVQMDLAFQYRRRQVLGDCTQLKRDLDSYNENYNTGDQLRICFDFSEDLAELEQPTEYPAFRPDRSSTIELAPLS
jgi:hypothetical protein